MLKYVPGSAKVAFSPCLLSLPPLTFWRRLQDLMDFMKEIAVNSTWFFRNILHGASAISVVLALDLGLAGSVNSQGEATWSSIFGYYGEISGFSS